MAIHQTKRQTDLEKRLQLLRRQIYGKVSENSERLRVSDKPENQIIRNSDTLIVRSSDTPSHSESFRSDLTYLHQDLLKIAIFSSLAIGAQILLYFASRNHLINLFK